MARRVRTLFVASTWLLSFHTLNGQVPPPLAQPDFALAGIAEETDSAQVQRRLGKPDSVLVDQHPFDVGAKLVTWRYKRLTVDFFSSDRVVGLSTTDPGVRTPRGLRVGDSVVRLKQLYGEPTGSYEDAWDYDDRAEHLHVMRITVRDGHVAAIYLGYLLD